MTPGVGADSPPLPTAPAGALRGAGAEGDAAEAAAGSLRMARGALAARGVVLEDGWKPGVMTASARFSSLDKVTS